MSGGITLTAVASYAAIAGAAVTAATSIAKAVSGDGAPKSNPAQANGVVDAAGTQAAKARSQLLETAGATAGDPLAPGEVSNNSGNVLGN